MEKKEIVDRLNDYYNRFDSLDSEPFQYLFKIFRETKDDFGEFIQDLEDEVQQEIDKEEGIE